MTTTKVLLFKFRCNIFIGVRIIKEMPGSVASGTPCTIVFLKMSTELLETSKGKTIPLQAWTGHEGSRSLSLSDFKTIDT